MPLHSVPGALVPYTPFPQPVPIIVAAPGDAPLVCLQINQDWIPYILGCLNALRAASTWDSDDENVVATMQENAHELQDMIASYEACPVIEFRNNPTQPINFDYSLDGGATWLTGPDQAAHITPVFTADSDSPSGYDISVNGGGTSDDVPLFTATDPNAVIKDPSTGDENVVEATTTAPGMTVQGTQLGVGLVRNGASLQLQKITDLGNLAEAIIDIVETGDYTTPILEILSSI